MVGVVDTSICITNPLSFCCVLFENMSWHFDTHSSLAQLGRARANALQARISEGGDAPAARARALADYKEFFALWKEADPDVPILKQAQAEYAKLQ